MIQLIPLLTSVFTVFGMWLAGNHDHRAWYVGIANQGLWLTFIITFQAWGLLPLLVALLFVYSRNLIRWKGQLGIGAEALTAEPNRIDLSEACFDELQAKLPPTHRFYRTALADAGYQNIALAGLTFTRGEA